MYSKEEQKEVVLAQMIIEEKNIKTKWVMTSVLIRMIDTRNGIERQQLGRMVGKHAPRQK